MQNHKLLSDTISKIYHLKSAQLQQANEMISGLLREEPKEEKRQGGKYKGQFVLKKDFDEPLPDDILNVFNGQEK